MDGEVLYDDLNEREQLGCRLCGELALSGGFCGLECRGEWERLGVIWREHSERVTKARRQTREALEA